MKKFLVTLLITMLAAFSLCTFTGCSEITNLLDSIVEELATERFYDTYEDSIIGNSDIVELENVNLTVGAKDGDALIVEGSAQVVITNGTYNGGQTPLGGAGNTALWVRSADARVVINDGCFLIGGLAEGDTGHIDMIYCTQGTIEINGGWFQGSDETVWLLNCKDQYYKDGTAKIVVKGGSFVNFDPSNCISEGENTNFVADGYKVVPEVFDKGLETEYTLYTVIKA